MDMVSQYPIGIIRQMLVMDVAKEIVDVMTRLITLAAGRPCVHSIYATYSLTVTAVCDVLAIYYSGLADGEQRVA